MLSFRCKSKTEDEFRVIKVDPIRRTVICDCNGFDGTICSHIDATLLAGERFMVPEADHTTADRASKLVAGSIVVPNDWRGAWRKNNVWRGLSVPRGPRQTVDMTEEFGDDYYSRPKVCFTGTGPRARRQLLEEARLAGWQAVDDFQSGIKVLVAEDPTKNSNKLKKARQFAVPILSYEEWDTLHVDGSFA